MPLQGEVASAWRLVHHVVDELERNPSLLGKPLILERFSEALLTSFLCSQPSNYSQWLRREAPPAEPRYVRLIEEYFEAHCDQPITAGDLAEIAGVSHECAIRRIQTPSRLCSVKVPRRDSVTSRA